MKLVLTGGGTGGHVYPAISIGLYIKEQFNAELFYLGNKGSIEEKIAKQHNIPFYAVSSQGLEGKNAFEKYVGFSLKNAIGVFQARKILKEIQPDYVLGTGGFVSAPVLGASITLKIPFGLHEQNSVMGKVNKLFVAQAKHVFHTFPIKGNEKHIHTGIPVRFKEPLEESGEYIVFTGGSGGSVKLNEFAVNFAKNNPSIPCIVTTGPRNYQDVMDKNPPSNLEVLSYAEDMLDLYKKSKVIIARSGAGSVFECANLNIPSIFVPLPNSAEDHQLKNAHYFSKKQAAILVQQEDNFEGKLTNHILELLKNDEKRNTLKQNIEQFHSRNAEEIIANIITKNNQS